MLIFSNFLSVANNGKRRRQVVSSQLPGRGNELTGYLFLFPPSSLKLQELQPAIVFLLFSSYCSFKALPFLTVRGTKLTQCSKEKKRKKMQFCTALRQQTPSSVHVCATALCFSVSQCSSVSAKCPHTDGKTASAVIFGAGGLTL